MKTLKQWLGLCEHQWKDLEKRQYFYSAFPLPGELPLYMEYIQRCSKCKKIRKFEV